MIYPHILNFSSSFQREEICIWKVGGKGGSFSALMSISQLDDAGRRLLISVPANQTDWAVRNEHCALGFQVYSV